MKKSEILRGRDLFKRIALTGRRLDGHLLRCTYLIHYEGEVHLQIAFKVPSKNLNAVRRNRLKRLMSEAISMDRMPLDISLVKSSVNVGMMIYYKDVKDVAVGKVTLMHIRKDIGQFCRAIASTL